MPDSPVEAAVRELHTLYHTNRRTQRRLKRTSRIITFCTLFVFTAALIALYSKANRMYALEQFKDPVEREAKEILQHLAPEMETLAREAGPVYARLAEERLEEALPMVHEATRTELHRLSESLTARAGATLNTSLTRLSQRQQRNLEAHFPSLATAAGGEEMKLRWKETIEDDVRAVLTEFRDRYAGDVDRLQGTLNGFRPNQFEEMTEEQVTRHFVHLWLMRLDRLVMEDDLGGGLDDE